MNGSLVCLATLYAATFVVYSQFDSSSQFGKPCSSSFQCWRTEPVLDDGSPFPLGGGPQRTKRLEIASKSRGARCRCTEGVCSTFHFPSATFLLCEEF